MDVCKSRLSGASAYFRELLSGKPSTGGIQEFYMPNEDPRVWHWFQVWLTMGRLRDKYDLNLAGWIDFLTFYFFAAEKDVPELQNQLVDVMGVLIQGVAPCPTMVDLIWTKTTAKSPLRRLVLEGFVYELCASAILRYHKYTNTEFLQDLIRYYQDISVTVTNQSWRPSQVPCRYHVHGPGDPSCPQAQVVLAQAANGLPLSHTNGLPKPDTNGSPTLDTNGLPAPDTNGLSTPHSFSP